MVYQVYKTLLSSFFLKKQIVFILQKHRQRTKMFELTEFQIQQESCLLAPYFNGHKVLFQQSVNDEPCQINYILFTS